VEHPVQGVFPLDVLWSADGKYVLAFVGSDHSMVLAAGSRIIEMVQVWDAATGQRVRSIPVMEPVTVNALGTGTDRPLVQQWTLNEHYLAAVNEQDQGLLEIWEIATGSKIATLSAESQRPASQVRGLAWAPDHEKMAIQWFAQDTTNGKSYRTIEIWNIAPLNKIATLYAESQMYFAEIVWAPDSRTVALILQDGAKTTYEIWDALAEKKVQTFKPTVFETPLRAWSPDGKYLVLGNKVYNVETGNRITTYTTQGTLNSLVWSPDGTRVALVDVVQHGVGFSSRSSTLAVLDALSGRQRAKYDGGGLFGSSGTTGRPVWSPDGKYVMVVGQDIDIWRGE
jgi:WD40 repeat protein